MFRFFGVFFLLFVFCIQNVFSFESFFEISEVLPQTQDDTIYEYVEIQNKTELSQSLSGYTISDASGKKFIFGNVILAGYEKKKFYRPETKILLNNTQETLFLSNDLGEIISQVSWDSSQKDVPIVFTILPPNDDNGEELQHEDETDISQGGSGSSQNLENSGSVLSSSGDILTQTGDIMDNSGNLGENSGGILFENSGSVLENTGSIQDAGETQTGITDDEKSKNISLLFQLQQPSYAQYFPDEKTLYCDPSKTECKINFDFRASFTGSFVEKDYHCYIDFGFGTPTGEEEKCNPTTLTFPKGETEILVTLQNIYISEEKVQEKLYVKNMQEGEESSENAVNESNQPEENTGSGIEENITDPTFPAENTGSIQDFIPLFSLQQPSYAIYSQEHKTFYCDPSKTECKINFDFRPSFTGSFLENDYSCHIDFGLGIPTGEEEKCNPNTVSYLSGSYNMNIKYYKKSNPLHLFEEKYTVQHIPQTVLVPDTESSSSGNSGGQDGGRENLSETHESMEILVGFQQPSSGTFSQKDATFYCDSSKTECKINFDFRPSFSGSFQEKDYLCENDFGLGVSTGEEKKCNPATLIYPQGKSEVTLKIISKKNPEEIFLKRFTVLYEYSALAQETENKITIASPDILVQSGLIGSGRYFQCEKEVCKINVSYEKRNPGEMCRWYFGKNIISGERRHTRCNPGYVTFGSGGGEFSLTIYEKGNDQNKLVTKFYVSEFVKTELPKTPLVYKKGEYPGEEEKIHTGSEFSENIFEKGKILLQGKATESKSFSGNILECRDEEKCNVNFDFSFSGSLKNYSFAWKLNGETFSEKQNPKSIWITKENGPKQYIEIEILDTNLQKIYSQRIEVFFSTSDSEKIEHSFVASSQEKKVSKSKKEKLPFTQNFLVLKYDGLRVSGKAPVGSEIQLFFGEKLMYSQKIGEDGKYRFVSKDFSPGNILLGTKIIYSNGREEWYSGSKEFFLEQEKRAYWFLPKKVKKAKKSSQKKTKTSDTTLQMKDSEKNKTLQEESFPFMTSFLYTGILSFFFFIFIGHIFFLAFGKNQKIPPKIVQQIFKTRQKIILSL